MKILQGEEAIEFTEFTNYVMSRLPPSTNKVHPIHMRELFEALKRGAIIRIDTDQFGGASIHIL